MIKNSPYLFFFYFEGICHKYIPYQTLSHDFDEKSDFLNYEFSIRLPVIIQFKNGWVQKRELVEGECDVIQTIHQNKRAYFSVHKRSARFMFYRVFLSRLALEKILPSRRCVALIRWRLKKIDATNNSGPTIWRSE